MSVVKYLIKDRLKYSGSNVNNSIFYFTKSRMNDKSRVSVPYFQETVVFPSFNLISFHLPSSVLFRTHCSLSFEC